jgi:hypothetical protein
VVWSPDRAEFGGKKTRTWGAPGGPYLQDFFSKFSETPSYLFLAPKMFLCLWKRIKKNLKSFIPSRAHLPADFLSPTTLPAGPTRQAAPSSIRVAAPLFFSHVHSPPPAVHAATTPPPQCAPIRCTCPCCAHILRPPPLLSTRARSSYRMHNASRPDKPPAEKSVPTSTLPYATPTPSPKHLPPQLSHYAPTIGLVERQR